MILYISISCAMTRWVRSVPLSLRNPGSIVFDHAQLKLLDAGKTCRLHCLQRRGEVVEPPGVGAPPSAAVEPTRHYLDGGSTLRDVRATVPICIKEYGSKQVFSSVGAHQLLITLSQAERDYGISQPLHPKQRVEKVSGLFFLV